MGAETFSTIAKGKTAKDAFRSAVEQAQYDHGHSGYTGTIAEKCEFTIIPLPKDADPEKYAWQLIDDRDGRIDDKWGPAGCIKIDAETFLFFGWASS